MNRIIETKNAPPSFSAYAQAVEVPENFKTLHVSGQVGCDQNGSLPTSDEEQHERAWQNVFAIAEAAGMSKEDIVDVLAIVSDHAQVAIYRNIRDKMLGGHMCSSTMLVCGMAHPDWKVEIAVKASKAV